MQPAGLKSQHLRATSVCGMQMAFYITPTGMPYVPQRNRYPLMALDGRTGVANPPRRAFYRRPRETSTRSWRGLHAHFPFAVSIACLRHDIPPFHYMIARFGGDTIAVRITPFLFRSLSTVKYCRDGSAQKAVCWPITACWLQGAILMKH